jgi:hypothetical protein
MKATVVRYQAKPVPTFQAFVAGIADRCDVAPVATGATVVGRYR